MKAGSVVQVRADVELKTWNVPISPSICGVISPSPSRGCGIACCEVADLKGAWIIHDTTGNQGTEGNSRVWTVVARLMFVLGVRSGRGRSGAGGGGDAAVSTGGKQIVCRLSGVAMSVISPVNKSFARRKMGFLKGVARWGRPPRCLRSAGVDPANFHRFAILFYLLSRIWLAAHNFVQQKHENTQRTFAFQISLFVLNRKMKYLLKQMTPTHQSVTGTSRSLFLLESS